MDGSWIALDISSMKKQLRNNNQKVISQCRKNVEVLCYVGDEVVAWMTKLIPRFSCHVKDMGVVWQFVPHLCSSSDL